MRCISVYLPEGTIAELDLLAQLHAGKRSEVVRRMIQHYLLTQKAGKLRATMRRGYQEMAALNQALAEEDLAADTAILAQYEEVFGRECG